MASHRNKPGLEPTILATLVGAAVPLAVAVIVASIGGFFAYLFWFGMGWIFN